VFEAIPVIDKDLLKDVPVLRGFCKHQGAPSRDVRMVAVQLFSHVSRAQSIPSLAFTRARSPIALILVPQGLQGSWKMKIPMLSSRFATGQFF
jgi:hypothetical protein